MAADRVSGLVEACLDKAEDDFYGDPRGNGTTRGVMRRNESPRADRLHGAVIEAHADSLNDLDLGSAAVGAYQNAQRDFSLQLGFASFVGVLRIGAVGAARAGDSRLIRTLRATLAGEIARGGADGIVGTVADGVAIGAAGRIVLVRHPRDADVSDGRQDVRSGGIKNRRRNGKAGVWIVRESGFYELNRRAGRKTAPSRWEQVMAAAVSSSAAWMMAAKAIQQIRWDWKKTRNFAGGRKQIVMRNRRVSSQNDQSCDDCGMCQQ